MRTLYIPLLIIAVIASSCQGKFTIAKRKYNKGFYVSTGKAPKRTNEKTANTNNHSKQSPAIDEEIVNAEPLISKSLITESKNTVVAAESYVHEKQSSKRETNKPSHALTASKDRIYSYAQKQFKPFEINPKNNTSAPKGKSSNSDAKLILCVIIALFIPPLGMFLWKQEADIWFILDLVFFLFYFTWFYWGRIGLIGLAAIIIALFRIFDLI